MRRHVLSLFAILATMAFLVPELAAQRHPVQPLCVDGCGGGDHTAPLIWLNTGGDVDTQYPYLEIEFCDNVSLNAGTRSITVNGSAATSAFGYDSDSGDCPGGHALSTTSSVALNIGSNTIYATICDNAANCGSETWYINRLAGPVPSVSLAPYSSDVQDYGRCAAACFAATYAQSTVPYFSLDTPRNVTLVYNGDRVDPKPFIHVDVGHGGDGSNLPSYFYLKVLRGGVPVTFINGETELHFAAIAGTVQRLGGQFNATANSMAGTGVYPVTVVVGAFYASGVVETAVATRVIVVNWTSSGVGRGWSVAGFQRLYPVGDSALVDEADGSATYFRRSGSSSFTSPTGDFSRLTTNGTSWTRTYPDSTKVIFNSGGYIYTVTDRFSNVVQYIFDGNGRPSQLWDPTYSAQNQLAITLSYGSYGLSGITDPYSRATSLSVASDGRLTSITDPDNVATGFAYDGSLRLSTITDRAGASTTLGYHSASGVSSGKLATLTAPTVAIFGEGNVAPVTTVRAWQHPGVPYGSTSSPLVAVRADTVRGWVWDARGDSSWMTVNGFGQPTRTAAALGDTVTVTYNAAGQPTYVASRLGIAVVLGYDGNGFLTSSMSPGDTSFIRYAGWAQADSTWGTAPSQHMTIGTAGRVDAVRVAGTRTTNYSYDGRGRVTEVRDPLAHLVRHTWFSGTNDNRSRDSLPGGGTVSYVYDSYGRLTTQTPSGAPARTVTYDAINRVLTQSDGVNANATRYFYNALRLDSLLDPANQRYGFTYNALGWATARSDPTYHSDTYEYDRDGQVRRHTNRRDSTLEQTWDALHRPLVRSGSGIQPDTASYATDGSSVSASNANATETTFFNSRRLADSVRTVLRLPNSTTRTFTRQFWYRSANNLLDSMATVDASGTVSFVSRGFAYTPSQGRLDGIRLGTSGWTNFTYNTDLSLTNIAFPGSDTLAISSTEADEAARVNSFILDDTLHYDAFGRLNRFKTDDGRDREFAYDSLGRLRKTTFRTASGVPCTYEVFNGWLCGALLDSANTFTYDPVGNRTGIIRDPINTWLNTYATYTEGNHIASFGTCSYLSDLDGNVTSRRCAGQPLDSLVWSADGRLSWDSTNNVKHTFYYDAAGRLIRQDAGGSPVSWYLWNGDDLLAELGSTATTKVAEYSYYGTDAVHAVIVGATPYFAHTDAAGSPRGYSNSGTRSGSYGFDEWGHLASGSSGLSDADRTRWKGALLLEPSADLYYMRNRWYEPRSGRFLSEDPTGLNGGINPYAFAGGDPIDGRDPNGLNYQCFRTGREFTRYHWLEDGRIVSTTWTVWDDPVCFEVGSGRVTSGASSPIGALRTHSTPVTLPAGLPGHGEAVLRCAGSLTSLTANTYVTYLLAVAAVRIVSGVVVAGVGILASIAGPSPDAAWNRGSELIGLGLKLLLNAVNPVSTTTAVGAAGDLMSGNLGVMTFVPAIGLPSAVSAAVNNCVP